MVSVTFVQLRSQLGVGSLLERRKGHANCCPLDRSTRPADPSLPSTLLSAVSSF